MSHLGTAAVELLTDRNKLAMAVGGFSALFLGAYGAREAARVTGGAVERWLGTPRLVSTGSRMGSGPMALGGRKTDANGPIQRLVLLGVSCGQRMAGNVSHKSACLCGLRPALVKG